MKLTDISSSQFTTIVKLMKEKETLLKKVEKIDKKLAKLQGGTKKVVSVKSSPVVRSPRGELKANVIAALKKAGAKGISVQPLAEKLGMKSQALHTFFYTTGKKIPGLKKIGPGQWVLGK